MKKIFMLSAALPILAMAQVGINTTTPAATLDVQTKGNTETTKSLRIVNSDGKENVTVLDNGNVGINKTNPLSDIEIFSDKPTRGVHSLGMYGGFGGLFAVKGASGTLNNLQSTKASNQLGWFCGLGYNGSYFNYPAYPTGILLRASQDFSTSSSSARMEFYTTPKDNFEGFLRMVISEDGNVGINNPTPQTKLDIYSPTPATAIKIVDGSQGAGKVLTSDANGVGTWTNPASIMPTIMGNYGSGVDIPYTNDGSWHYTGSSITLPPNSKYIININFLIGLQSPPLDTNGYIFLRTIFSDNNINANRSADVVDGVLISGTISSNASYGNVNGSCIVYNNSTSPKTYYLWAGAVVSSAGTTKNIAKFGGNYWSERSFYATPIN